jgi:hypothetical protein
MPIIRIVSFYQFTIPSWTTPDEVSSRGVADALNNLVADRTAQRIKEWVDRESRPGELLSPEQLSTMQRRATLYATGYVFPELPPYQGKGVLQQEREMVAFEMAREMAPSHPDVAEKTAIRLLNEGSQRLESEARRRILARQKAIDPAQSGI